MATIKEKTGHLESWPANVTRTLLTGICSPCIPLRPGLRSMTHLPALKGSDVPHNQLLTVIWPTLSRTVAIPKFLRARYLGVVSATPAPVPRREACTSHMALSASAVRPGLGSRAHRQIPPCVQDRSKRSLDPVRGHTRRGRGEKFDQPACWTYRVPRSGLVQCSFREADLADFQRGRAFRKTRRCPPGATGGI